MTDANLDRAAQMAGYDGWEHVVRCVMPWAKDRIKDHAATLDELDAAKAELEAFKQEVSDKAERLKSYANRREVNNILDTLILPKPDPVIVICREIGLASYRPEQIRAALAKHGLKLERIEHE